MATRTLPERKNPETTEDASPSHEELLERRRLGRTKLSVKPNLVGTSNATAKENLGPVEYAHLRAPLPENLSGSEIFTPQAGQPHPTSYFFMRRSKDGFVSATGMFKIAFPWSTHAEERDEREYLKALETTSTDDVAGNIWVAPEFALELAEEYGLTHWLKALLDPTDIQTSPTSVRKNITAPPKFEMPAALSDVKLSPPPTLGKRSRATRAASPSKSTPGRVKASPRKRQTKKEKEANNALAEAASASLQSALDDATSIAEVTPAPESVTNDVDDVEGGSVGGVELNGDAVEAVEAVAEALAEESAVDENQTVRVEVDQEVEKIGDTEVTHTNVTVEMPVGLPELPLPEDTEKMLQQAKEMVEKAREIEGLPKVTRQKRRIEEVEATDIDAELPVQPAKRAKVLEEKYKRERVRTRAVFGVAASLAVAAAIPFLQTFF